MHLFKTNTNICMPSMWKLFFGEMFYSLINSIALGLFVNLWKLHSYIWKFVSATKKKYKMQWQLCISQFWLYLIIYFFFNNYYCNSKFMSCNCELKFRSLDFFSKLWLYIFFKRCLILRTKISGCITKCIFRSKIFWDIVFCIHINAWNQICDPGGVLQKDPNFKILSYLFGNHGNFS